MVGGTRSELNYESPDSSTVSSAYSNVHRRSYSSVGLDRCTSFRDGGDNNRIGVRGGTGSSLASEVPPLSQFVALEPIVMGDQKFTRVGELKKVLGVSTGSTNDDHFFGPAHMKITLPITMEEVKRYKESLLDTSNKARDRIKKMNESVESLDQYIHAVMPRKRRMESCERAGVSSISKMGSQIQQIPPDLVSQRLEDNNKSLILNRRVRSSLVESEGRNVTSLRIPFCMNKSKDMLKAGSGNSIQIEEKLSALPATVEGWDRTMKRKRSAGGAVTRAMDGDREPKRATITPCNIDPRLRSCDSHSVRSGPSVGFTGANKLYVTSHLTASNSNSARGYQPETDPFPIDRRDYAAPLLDKERIMSRGNNRLNSRGDTNFSNTFPITKGKATRASRTGSALTKSSSNFSHMPGSLNGLEETLSTNKVESIGGGINQKCPIPTESSSPPMAQFLGQRPQQISRTRRANLVSPVPAYDEGQISCERSLAQDVGALLPSSELNGLVGARGKSNKAQQVKIKFEKVSYTPRLSETEESGLDVEIKLKEKGLITKDEERLQKLILPTKKNKSLAKEETGDDVPRRGRGGRGSTLPKARIHKMKEKFENPKPQLVGLISDTTESKSGRRTSKKVSELKTSNRPGKVLNSTVSNDITCVSDDDYEELLAAAKSVSHSKYLAYSGSFWKKMEPVFSFVRLEDMTYLKQQAVTRIDPTLNIDSSSGTLDTEKSFGMIPSLYQRVLSAIIVEEEIKETGRECESREESFECASNYSFSGMRNQLDVDDQYIFESDSGVGFRSRKHYKLDSGSSNGSTVSNSLRSPSIHDRLPNEEMCVEDESLTYSEVGMTSDFDNLDRTQSLVHTVSANSSSEFPCDQICLEDRLLLELQSIGLYPEVVPDLVVEGEQDINTEIAALDKVLEQQMMKKRIILNKIEKIIQSRKEVEWRDLEQDAMDKLVEMAYKKRLASFGNKASKYGVSKISKQAALAFAKRTIARCQEFESTGKSCFQRSVFQDIIFRATPYIDDTKLVETMGIAISTSVEAPNNQIESKATVHDMINSNKSEKVELLLDHVAASNASSAIGDNAMGGGPVGRKTERERDQKKCTPRSSAPRAGRSLIGERKAKLKSKQKTAQLSTSGNLILDQATAETAYTNSSLATDGNSRLNNDSKLPTPGNILQNSSIGNDDPVDFTNLQLSELDSMGDVSHNLSAPHDLSWFNFDEDGLQDHDSMGLEIPMDDLSELNMLM